MAHLLTALARQQGALGAAGWSLVAAGAALVALRVQGRKSELYTARRMMKSIEKLLSRQPGVR